MVSSLASVASAYSALAAAAVAAYQKEDDEFLWLHLHGYGPETYYTPFLARLVGCHVAGSRNLPVNQGRFCDTIGIGMDENGTSATCSTRGPNPVTVSDGGVIVA